MGFMTAVPARELADGQEDRDEDEDQGCVAAGGCAPGVGRLCFCWWKAG